MATPPEFDAAAAHRYFAAHCFNSAWPLIDKAERTPEEETQLLALGHASLWHWTQRADCTDKSLSVGHWMLSRIYSVLREPAGARRYAESCLRMSGRPLVEPFYLAFAHEAVARAAALREDWATVSTSLRAARELAEQVADPANRKLLLDDLSTVRAGA
ncbi:MAG: hypothetical protein FJ104_06930 [Deltaproteobacteria bacterium]|nr:hypothetical protein [Deltaproteobacteria bacterium]